MGITREQRCKLNEQEYQDKEKNLTDTWPVFKVMDPFRFEARAKTIIQMRITRQQRSKLSETSCPRCEKILAIYHLKGRYLGPRARTQSAKNMAFLVQNGDNFF